MTCTISDLIQFLERCPPSSIVVYDNGKIPRYLCSWRGDYTELALSQDGAFPISVGDILKDLRDAIGKTYEGYKGGEYQMNGATGVYCDNWGQCTNTHIVGGIHRDGVAVLKTTRPQEMKWEVTIDKLTNIPDGRFTNEHRQFTSQ